MLAWLKRMVSEEITVEELEQGGAFLSATMGTPYFTAEHPGPDMSEHVKRFGTVTRIFKNTRDDN